MGADLAGIVEGALARKSSTRRDLLAASGFFSRQRLLGGSGGFASFLLSGLFLASILRTCCSACMLCVTTIDTCSHEGKRKPQK